MSRTMVSNLSDEYVPYESKTDGSSGCQGDDNSMSYSGGLGNELSGLPTRVFSNDRYPVDKKINGYSRLEYLIDVLDILDGTPEYDIVVNSVFGPLFALRARRCGLAGKLVHNFISRQIHDISSLFIHTCVNSNPFIMH